MAHIESTALRDRLVNLLRSKTCRAINFEVLNIPVRGIAYNTVAEAIGRDSSDGISIEINAKHLDKVGALATYNGRAKTFTFASENVGAAGPRAAYHNMLLVHEATHAQIDLTLPTSTDRFANETAAYIAQGAFNHLAGGKVKNISKLWKEADEQGRKAAIPYASPYAFAAEEIGGLLQELKGLYVNGDVETESNRTGDIVEPVGRWRVEAAVRLGDTPEYTWVYDFKSDKTVTWANAGSSELGGSGTWKLSRSTVSLSIKWKGTTATDIWIPPQISNDGKLSGDLMIGDVTFANGKKYKLYGKIMS